MLTGKRLAVSMADLPACGFRVPFDEVRKVYSGSEVCGMDLVINTFINSFVSVLGSLFTSLISFFLGVATGNGG